MHLKGFFKLRKYSTQVKTTKFFTTPIYYVNASPHIGHLYSSLIADAAQRWQRLLAVGADIKFSTGTDEHGSKIQQAARQNGVPASAYCRTISTQFEKLARDFDVGYTDFTRTTADNHRNTVELFWNTLRSKDRFYLAKYEGWYCVPDETFLTESQLKETVGSDGKKLLVSIESGHPVEWSSEENYMFKLSQYRDDLIYWLKTNENSVRPKKFRKIALDFLHQDGGLQDLSVSRPTKRINWGIPVPDDPSHTIYVWLDALTNYLTAAGYGTDASQFQQCWPPDVQVIGKDILKFHAIYWPAFLIAADLEPPRTIFCHSHWTVDNEKMSKSKGNVVCPFKTAETYTTDGFRYFLLREGVAHSDGNYSDLAVLRALNSELADTFGNLLNRCTGSALNPEQKFPEIDVGALEEIRQSDVAKTLMENVENLPETCKDHYDEMNFYKSIDAILATLRSANLFFETLRPWELAKAQETRRKLDTVLHVTLETLRIAGVLLQPITPNISKVLLDKINIPVGERTFIHSKHISWRDKDFKETDLAPGKVVLFKRIVSDDKKAKSKN
ncbi:unnamed protein product [Phyllotreta striolata]|uniref:Methionine--tRNA ligase, mitochondrial n=1 Tax=Phyllotreta striolata TaxID=444603 RepID=A0A9N9XR09_PHYSR|nr:unnamed protein product [Phyllotreta striolata]